MGDRFATVRGEITAKVAELEDRIALAEAGATPERAGEIGVTVQEMQERALRLREMRSVFEDHLDSIDAYDEVQKSIVAADAELQSFTGIPEPAPFTPWFVDSFRDALDARIAQYDIARRALEQAQQQVAKAVEDTKLRAGELSVATEKRAVNDDAAQRATLEWSADAAKVFHELVQTRKAWAEFMVELGQARVDLRDKERDLAERRLKTAEAGERYVAEDLETRRAEIVAEREQLSKERAEAEAQRDKARKLLEEARATLAEAEQDAEYDDAKYAVTQALVERRRTEAEGAQDKATLLREQLDYVYNLEDIWGARYSLHMDPKVFPLRQQRARLTDFIASLGVSRRTNETREDVLREDVRELSQRMAQMQPSLNTIDNTQPTLKIRTAQLDQIGQSLNARGRVEKLASRTLAEVIEVEQRQSLGQRLQQVGETAQRVWERQLFEIDGSPLTVGKIGISLIIVVLGLMLTRIATRLLGRALRSRPHIDPTAAAIVERLAYYGLMVLVVLFALNTVNIPLTVFTFLGGALAIGVGFGAQNLINNFISGLILMVERPIKIGDVVEVDGQRGRIVEIGARCSHLSLFTGIDILVPNSIFLEKNVVNWTLNDSKVQYSLTVSVVHGSNTRDVTKLLMKAIEDHGKILKTPPPNVHFKDIATNALVFEVFYWINIGDGSDGGGVSSDLRHMIEGAFSNAGIAFAITAAPLEKRSDSNPLEVRLVRAATELPAASAPAKHDKTDA
ncbi:MAG: mechanosensitive ion channel [Candidatus Hydrogenedentes bacterium]|nr:mechanosensitive ion channel [Candidatus Hydrogenedentota bacterium]